MEIDESKFIKGFNAGYLLAQHEPSLITNLLKSVQPTTSYISNMSFGQKEYEPQMLNSFVLNFQPVNSYISGMSCGLQEYVLENSKSHLNELDQLRYNKSMDKDIDRN